MAATMPRSTLRWLALDLRFSGRRRQSADGDSSTLTLTLIPGASGAATTTPNLPFHRLCSRSLLLFSQGLMGGASAMVGWQSNGCVVTFFWVVCGGAPGHQPQSLATYVACTKCVQASLSETCMQLVSTLSKNRQRIYVDDFSTTRIHSVQNPRISM